MQALAVINGLIALLDTALNAEGAITGVLQPILAQMEADNRLAMTPEEKAHLRGLTDAAKAYAQASKPGMPVGQ